MEGGGSSPGLRGEREDVRAMGRRSRTVRRAKKDPWEGMDVGHGYI